MRFITVTRLLDSFAGLLDSFAGLLSSCLSPRSKEDASRGRKRHEERGVKTTGFLDQTIPFLIKSEAVVCSSHNV